jgi:TonB family protein
MRKDYFELNYPLRIRLVFMGVMFFLITIFYAFPKIIESKLIIEEAEYTEILKVELVTPIQQQQKFQSARPAIPIEADDESEIDTLDFMDTDIEGFDSWAAPPSKKKGAARKFVAYDKPPTPKKTLSPRYPDICKTAGVEGRVVIEFYIDETGKVDQSSVAILNSVPCLDQVCLNEIKKSKWKPARQGKEKVGVYLTKTFNFTLEQGN